MTKHGWMLSAVILLGVACGGDSGGGTAVEPAEPAQEPSGPNARTIDYTCGGRPDNSILVELQSSDELAELVNGIDLCEFDDGLVEISAELPCPQGLLTVTVPATDGEITDQAVIDACELASQN